MKLEHIAEAAPVRKLAQSPKFLTNQQIAQAQAANKPATAPTWSRDKERAFLKQQKLQKATIDQQMQAILDNPKLSFEQKQKQRYKINDKWQKGPPEREKWLQAKNAGNIQPSSTTPAAAPAPAAPPPAAAPAKPSVTPAQAAASRPRSMDAMKQGVGNSAAVQNFVKSAAQSAEQLYQLIAQASQRIDSMQGLRDNEKESLKKQIADAVEKIQLINEDLSDRWNKFASSARTIGSKIGTNITSAMASAEQKMNFNQIKSDISKIEATVSIINNKFSSARRRLDTNTHPGVDQELQQQLDVIKRKAVQTVTNPTAQTSTQTTPSTQDNQQVGADSAQRNLIQPGYQPHTQAQPATQNAQGHSGVAEELANVLDMQQQTDGSFTKSINDLDVVISADGNTLTMGAYTFKRQG